MAAAARWWPTTTRLFTGLAFTCAILAVELYLVEAAADRQQVDETQATLLSRHQNAPPRGRRTNSNGVAIEITPPPPNMLFHYLPPTLSKQVASQTLLATANRSARTAAELLGPDELATNSNLFVSNTCERDFMLVKVKTSRPFYGVIHTLDYRRKLLCSIEGDGATDYQLNISHALDSRDPLHCGAIKLRRRQSQASEDETVELISVVLAIRAHRNIELSDDKLMVLNCTNRCRRPDCSSGLSSGRLSVSSEPPTKQRQLEKEFDDSLTEEREEGSASKPGGGGRSNKQTVATPDPCTVWRFPWLLALVCCMAVLLAGLLISNCIIWLSFYRAGSTQSNGHTDRSKGSRRAGAKVARREYIDYDNAQYYDPANKRAPQTGLDDDICYQDEEEEAAAEEEERDSRRRRQQPSQVSHIHHHARRIPMAILDSDKTNPTKHNPRRRDDGEQRK